MSTLRLQKFLADAGVCSRRKAEELILSGVVSVNGEVVTKLGTKVTVATDTVRCRGTVVKGESHHYYLFHKPVGVTTTMSDRHAKQTISDFVKELPVRVVPVGRLDRDVSGLILLTNDGEHVNELLHPRNEVERRYYALVEGAPSEKSIRLLLQGVKLSDGVGKAKRVRVMRVTAALTKILRPVEVNETIVEFVVGEGRNHFVKRMLAAVGCPVRKLVRVQFGAYELGDLGEGEIREVKRPKV